MPNKDIAPLPPTVIEPIVRAALREDLGQSGDLSAGILIPEAATATLVFRAREAGVLSGWAPARMAYALIDPACALEVLHGDGAAVDAGTVVARVFGPSRALLTAERTALNFFSGGRLSGVATLTARFVAAADGNARIAATRKTTPGLRALEKLAVQHGGGFPHRESLASAIMIKDNHISLGGGIAATMDTLRARADHMTKVSVEVDSLAQLKTLPAVRARCRPARQYGAGDLARGRNPGGGEPAPPPRTGSVGRGEPRHHRGNRRDRDRRREHRGADPFRAQFRYWPGRGLRVRVGA